MTGPEHYAEAERLIGRVTEPAVVPGYGPVIKAGAPPETIALAQVHATLALAAATGLGAANQPLDDQMAWTEAASEWKKTAPEAKP